jgi:hypothetical protein
LDGTNQHKTSSMATSNIYGNGGDDPTARHRVAEEEAPTASIPVEQEV